MLYMVIEDFRGGDPAPVYQRLRDRGRMVPEGLQYVDSWVTQDLKRCFQIMECTERAALDNVDCGMERSRGLRRHTCRHFR